MKKTAKLISIVLCLMIAFGTVFAIAVNVSAAGAPSFELLTEKVDDDTISVTVKLVSGGFNAFNGGFEATEGVKCTSIKQGKTWRDFKNNEEDEGKPVAFVSNIANGQVGCSNVTTFEEKGDFIVATFDVDFSKAFSISFKTEVCKVDDSDVSSAVKSATYEYVPESVDPTEPSKPEEPTEPSKPEEPTEPSKPEEPTEPSKPEEPTEPSKPEEPTEPSKPEEPTEPSKPEEPTEPSKPEEPTEPSKPEEPTEPSKPEEPTEPSKPEDPTKPVEPTEPTNTVTPADPSTDKKDDKKDDTSAKADKSAEKGNTAATGTDAISPNTGDVSKAAVCAIVTTMSGAAITLVLRKKNESEE